MRTFRISLPSVLLNSLSSGLAFGFLGYFIECNSAVLTKQSRCRFRRRHLPPGKYAFLAAGVALAYQECEALFAVGIFAANHIHVSAVETLELVGMFVPTKWAHQY